jgi:hypothetical protein
MRRAKSRRLGHPCHPADICQQDEPALKPAGFPQVSARRQRQRNTPTSGKPAGFPQVCSSYSS